MHGMLDRTDFAIKRGPAIGALDPWVPSAGRMRQLLSERERVRLARIAPVVRFRKRETIYWEGDPAEAVFNIVGGAAKVCRTASDGAEHISAFLFPGDLFGLAQEGRYVGTIRALTPVTAFRFAVPALRRILADDATLEFHLIVKLMHELRQSQHHAVVLATNRAVAKVAMFLHMLERLQPASGEAANQIFLPMTRSDIAEYVGITLSATSRAFRSLTEGGILALRGRRHVTIADRVAFAKLAGVDRERAPAARTAVTSRDTRR
jgi:CRP/FNR family transcriptional regulator